MLVPSPSLTQRITLHCGQELLPAETPATAEGLGPVSGWFSLGFTSCQVAASAGTDYLTDLTHD